MAKATHDEPSRCGAGMYRDVVVGTVQKMSVESGVPVHLAMTDWRSSVAARVWSSSLLTSRRTSGLLSNVASGISGVVERTYVPAAGSRWKGCKVKSFWVPNFYSHNYGLISAACC
ncbi:uncharacterized protein [Triticum aestivum]|uniref:uncharacterized protein n=1 Tax=Triticum aestivum TaxID=4565 RepID=UPI001D01812A|nr:uncharacterized protein LOC123163069 [Triticum aestivum]